MPLNLLGYLSLAGYLLAADDGVVHRLPAAAGVFPQGARPGVTLDAEVLGEHLDRAATVAFFDSQVNGTVVEASPTKVKLRIVVADNAAFGPHYFRLITPQGASGPVLFRIGDLPRIREKEPNSVFAEAMPVTVPATIDGRLNVDGDFDFYRFRAQQGSTWIFDLRAARNGNGLDAALILLDGQGRKLAHSEDHFVWDPFFSFTFAQTGEYVAVIQPTHRSNDATFAYELDIRQSPQLQTIAPLSFAPGVEMEATVFGVGLLDGQAKVDFPASPGFRATVSAARGDAATIRLAVPADARQGVHEMVLTGSAGRSNPVRFLVDSTPQHKGGALLPPVSVNGVMRYREPERFPFSVKEGEALVFEIRAGRFGSPVDSMVRVLDKAGKVIASNDDFTFPVADFYNRDSRLMHKFKAAGEYVLEVRNMVGTSGENYPYQLLVTPPSPHFALSLESERPYLYAGKETKIKVSAMRLDGHDAPIEVELRGLPAGFTADKGEIPSGKKETSIVVHGAENATAGVAASLSVRAGSEAAWKPVRIASGGGEGATFARVDQALLVVAEKPSFSLEAAVTSVSLPQGTTAVIPVMIRREKDFNADIEFRLDNLPPGVSLAKAVAKPGEQRIELKVTAAQDAAKGRSGRVAILGQSGKELREAPRVSIQVE